MKRRKKKEQNEKKRLSTHKINNHEGLTKCLFNAYTNDLKHKCHENTKLTQILQKSNTILTN